MLVDARSWGFTLDHEIYILSAVELQTREIIDAQCSKRFGSRQDRDVYGFVTEQLTCMTAVVIAVSRSKQS